MVSALSRKPATAAATLTLSPLGIAPDAAWSTCSHGRGTTPGVESGRRVSTTFWQLTIVR
jgi:hypothetical protein